MNLLHRIGRHLSREASLWILFSNSLIAYSVHAEVIDENFLVAKIQKDHPSIKNEGYTINFNNVSIIEYLRFVSKVTGLNFVFDETELGFNITIVSEEPISLKNIMSALIQVLRVHNMMLIEQENNLIITSSTAVREVATIAASDTAESARTAPLVTKVFRIKNSNPNTIASIIRPMVSRDSIIEVANETKQVIVTDVISNIEKISDLLAILDTPHSPLEIESYQAKNVAPSELVTLSTQILNPFSEGSTLLLVPQSETQTIFIVSTPNLIERAMTVLEDLDIPSRYNTPKPVLNENIYVYKILHRNPDDLLKALKQVSTELKASTGSSPKLVDAIDSVKWIEYTNSLLFIVDSDTLAKLKDLLTNLDQEQIEQVTYYIYSVKQADQEKIEDALKQMANDLKKSGIPDQRLLDAINSMKWIKETNSFIFTGNPDSLKKIAELMPTFDVSSAQSFPSNSQFLIYNPANRSGEQLLNSVQEIAINLKDASLADPAFLKSVNSMRWVPSSNSLLFTGDTTTLTKIQTILKSLDVAELQADEQRQQEYIEKSSFIIYRPVHKTASQLQQSIDDFIQDLRDSGLADTQLLDALASVKLVEASSSLLFTGSPETLDKVKDVLATMDVPSATGFATANVGEKTFLIYKLRYITAQQLMASLQSFVNNLQKTAIQDKELELSIDTMRWVKETNSILFTGDPTTLGKIESLIEKFDVPEAAKTMHALPPSQPLSFVIYNPKYQQGPELIQTLQDFEQNLILSGVNDQNLFSAINNLKWIPKTSSILISGDQNSIAKVQELLTRFDVASSDQLASPAIESIDNTSFLIYKLQYHQGDEIQKALKQVAQSLGASSQSQNQNLITTVDSLQWIKITNSLLATGPQETLSRLKDLVQNLDVPLRQVFIEILVIETDMTNGQNIGLQWGGQIQYLTKVAGQTGNFPPAQTIQSNTIPGLVTGLPNLQEVSATRFPTAAGPPVGPDIPFSSGFDLGVIGDIIMHKGKSFISLGSLVNALQTDTDSTIVMNPKIITQDNNNSTIFVGQNIPFAGSTVVTTGQNAQQSTANIEYRDVGFNLSLTPVLGQENIITLDISVDISQQVANTTSSSTLQIQGVQTSHTTMNTRVHVPDKHFLALSGMLSDTKTHFKSGIPCLGGIPVVGLAFSSNQRQDTKSNVIIFVRPHIINTAEEYRQLTENQEALYRDTVVLPVLKEEFDAGVDWVKTPENE